MYSLKKGELEIMELLWRKGRALTHAEISELLKDTIGRNTVYLHLNRLLDKGAIQIGPSVRRAGPMEELSLPPLTKQNIWQRKLLMQLRLMTKRCKMYSPIF